jgi:hypothetical protein
MQCPLCASEISSNAIECSNCGATRVTQRTPAGVIVGWVGMTISLLSILWGIPLLVLPFTEHGIKGYDWSTLVAGIILAAGLLWYSKSTLHAKWVRRDR